MLRHSLALLLLTATVTFGAASLRAQSGPAGTRAKQSARNAVAKTDAHTRTMQGPTSTTERPARSASGQAQVTQTSSPQKAQSAARSGDDASVAVRGGKDEVAF